MPKFRKKPVVVEAVEFLIGDPGGEVRAFLESEFNPPFGEPTKARFVYPGVQDPCYWKRTVGDTGSVTLEASGVEIDTLEGTIRADPGDWIIRGVNGEVYPCKPDIFEKTYDPVDPGHSHGVSVNPLPESVQTIRKGDLR